MNESTTTGHDQSKALEQGQQKEILLVMLVLDDSGSINDYGNTDAVINGYNEFVEQQKNAPGNIRVSTMFLNKAEHIPFQEPKDVSVLTNETYQPRGNTSLFLRTLQAIQYLAEQVRVYEKLKFVVRSMLFVYTDGADNASGQVGAPQVKEAWQQQPQDKSIFGGCAVGNGHTPFELVFDSMGVPSQWIKVLKNDPVQVQQGLSQAGSMASIASSGGASFGHTSRYGFGSGDTQS